MQKQSKKPLRLSRETVRPLADHVLEQAAGAGYTYPMTACTCPSWDKACPTAGCGGGGGHTLQ